MQDLEHVADPHGPPCADRIQPAVSGLFAGEAPPPDTLLLSRARSCPCRLPAHATGHSNLAKNKRRMGPFPHEQRRQMAVASHGEAADGSWAIRRSRRDPHGDVGGLGLLVGALEEIRVDKAITWMKKLFGPVLVRDYDLEVR